MSHYDCGTMIPVECSRCHQIFAASFEELEEIGIDPSIPTWLIPDLICLSCIEDLEANN